MNTVAISGLIDPAARAEGVAIARSGGRDKPETAAAPGSSAAPKTEPAPLDNASAERAVPGADPGDELLLRNLYRSTRLKLDFRVDDATQQVVISVIDPETDEIVRQVPPEEILRMAERLDAVRGRLFSSTV